MDPSTTPDPVNRWATEHYGFDDEPTPPPAPGARASTPSTRADLSSPRSRRRSTALAAAVLSVLAGAAAFGGITMAANAADNGPGDGGRGATVTDGRVGRFDDRGPDGGFGIGEGRR